MATESEDKSDKKAGRSGLPFEPGRDKKKSQVSARAQAKADEILAENRQKAKDKAAAKGVSAGRASKSNGAIPEAVSRRMLRRMAVLSGRACVFGRGNIFLSVLFAESADYRVSARGRTAGDDGLLWPGRAGADLWRAVGVLGYGAGWAGGPEGI